MAQTGHRAGQPLDSAIEKLDLEPVAKAAAYELKRLHPGVVFTSGRRDKVGQAGAMASNVVKNRKFTEQRLSEKGMSRQAAVALLQRTERWAFGDKGCAIAWKKRPAIEADPTRGTRELVHRGDDCNCQARLVYAGNVLTGLVFRSAC